LAQNLTEPAFPDSEPTVGTPCGWALHLLEEPST